LRLLGAEDVVILLGDVGVNYDLGKRDKGAKVSLNRLGPTFLCVHGNHEERPENILGYEIVENDMGSFYQDARYPNILFCMDGNVYTIEGRTFLVLGGAYSVDKPWRVANRWHWFESEQMDDATKTRIRERWFGTKVDVIVSHTCPYRYMPREAFMQGLDQNTVDNSMERFLDECEQNIAYGAWFCGHWHLYKRIDKLTFLYQDIVGIHN